MRKHKIFVFFLARVLWYKMPPRSIILIFRWRRCWQKRRFLKLVIAEKVRETRLRWFGHVIRTDEEELDRNIMDVEIKGNRGREDRRKLGSSYTKNLELPILTRRAVSQALLWCGIRWASRKFRILEVRNGHLLRLQWNLILLFP